MHSQSPGLTIDDHQEDGHCSLVLSGELDFVKASALDARLDGLFSDGTDSLMLDLSDVKLIDATGLRSVLALWRLCHNSGHELTILPGPPQVQRVFEVCGLLERLPFLGGTIDEETTRLNLGRSEARKPD